MSIGAGSVCLECFLRKNVATARALGDDERLTRYTKELMGLLSQLPADKSTTFLVPRVSEMLTRYFGIDQDRFVAEKKASNAFALERFPQADALVAGAEDPVLAGIQMAILGNYLDFSALQGKVSFEKLDEMLRDALNMELDSQVVASLKKDLSGAKRLLYVTDNAGEICFDRVLARQLQKAYPQLQITFCVKGAPTLNDATREDAAAVGVEFPVIDNGNPYPGTDLDQLGEEAEQAFREADVILSKGMANVETLYGCGLNVYYAFLVKCAHFEALFQKPYMTPMLVKEQKSGV